MDNFRILTLVGGISRESLNKRFYQSILDLKPEGFEFETFDISKLPFFSQDLENDPPDIVTEFKEKIRDAEGVLIVTPEYNRSMPGVLKNAIDWGSRPYGMNLWDKKPAALIGASPGNIGTFGAQHHLRQVLAYLNMHVMGQPEFYFNATAAFDENNNLVNEKTKHLLHKYFSSFYNLMELILRNGEAKIPNYKSQGLEDSPLAH
jgi:chromate reductase, NAD(P)H dehydrogenase (quinone)